MSWVKACKQYQIQRGEGAKYIVPKKGSDEYEIVKKIFESMEKPPPKEKPVSVPKEKKVKVVAPKKSIRKSDRDDDGLKNIQPEETNIRKIIRDELIQQIREQGLESLSVA